MGHKMVFEHDYKRYPELTNTELQTEAFSTPFPQITEDFYAVVVKVHDGDTVTLRCDFRDFDFPLRFLDTNAPELSEEGGPEIRDWLEAQILDKEVLVMINPFNRVGKYGRLLGSIFVHGMNLSETMIMQGKATPFEARNEGQIPTFTQYLKGG